MLNEYFEEMAGAVFSFEGTIDKYIGDGMLAFFGDPVEQRDHAERAVRAAAGLHGDRLQCEPRIAPGKRRPARAGPRVSKATREALPSSILVHPAGSISAKGFSEPIEVFTVDVAFP